MNTNNKSEETTSATLADLDDRWIVPPPSDMRAIGGSPSQRFATDGASMFAISEAEFKGAHTDTSWQPEMLAWGMMPGTVTWESMDIECESSCALSRPDELRVVAMHIAARYGDTWIAVQYVDMAMRYGGTEIRITGEMSQAIVPGIAIIMPLDASDDGGES